MTPQQLHAENLQKNSFVDDVAQQAAVQSLQRLYDDLIAIQHSPPSFINRILRRNNSISGLYIWGGVGRGKTYLMDLFYQSIDFIDRDRVHYHKFMLDIHYQLNQLPKQPNPLMIIGQAIAKRNRVLCLDEFHVTDVADAMLLAGLLRALFENNVTLVITSNTRIDHLYLNGLQRQRFMEAISLLKQYTDEFELTTGQDYRLACPAQADTYMITSEQTQSVLATKFNALVSGNVSHGDTLIIYDRPIRTIALSDDVVWFDFHQLCETYRAAKDYLAIARLFHTVFISDIPILTDQHDSAAKRFVHLIDALYDHRVKLVASAEAKPNDLYQGRLMLGTFDRAVSRLIEMGSQNYLALPHKM